MTPAQDRPGWWALQCTPTLIGQIAVQILGQLPKPVPVDGVVRVGVYAQLLARPEALDIIKLADRTHVDVGAVSVRVAAGVGR